MPEATVQIPRDPERSRFDRFSGDSERLRHDLEELRAAVRLEERL
jgi:hypothetical protein